MRGKLKLKIGKFSESQIEDQILGYLVRIKRLCAWKQISSGFFDTKLKKFRRQHSIFARKGIPDIALIYKGRYIGLEVKSEKGKQSDSQKQMEKEILAAGGHYAVVRSMEDVILFMKCIDPFFS